MINKLHQTKRGKWILTIAILALYAASLFVWSPEVYRFDYDDYAVQEGDSLQSLLSRDGLEPREVTNFITQRITEKRPESYPDDFLMANSSPASRDGDHITTHKNTLTISHPGGEYEEYQISSKEDITMRRVQLGFYVVIITMVLFLCLSWVWEKTYLQKGKIVSMTAKLNRVVSKFRTPANAVFRAVMLASVVLVTASAISGMLFWALESSPLAVLLLYMIWPSILILLPAIITVVIWILTQLAHILLHGRGVRLSRGWAVLCFVGVYAVIAIGLLPWFI